MLVFVFFQILIGGMIFMPDAQGQTTGSPTPTPDPVLEEAQREATLAKARADKAVQEKNQAEAERDKLKATAQPFGTPNITAPTGKVTTDASGFVETQILGQEAARIITSRFANELVSIRGAKPKILIIYNATDLAAIASYLPILQQLKQFNADLELSHTEATKKINSARLFASDPDATQQMDPITLALAAPTIAAGAVKSVAELAQLFRSETSFANKDIPISEDTIVSYLTEKMSGVNIYYPSLFPPQLSEFGNKTALSGEFEKLQANKYTAEDDIKKIDDLTAQITKIKEEAKTGLDKAKGNTAEETKFKNRIDKADQRLKALIDIKNKIQFLLAAANQIIQGLQTPDSTTKITPFAQLVRSAQMQALMNADGTYTLRFSVTANGTTKIKQWLFFDAKVRHSAGARVVYQVFDKNGMIARANSFQFYFDWKSPEEVRACLDKPCLTQNERTQYKIP